MDYACLIHTTPQVSLPSGNVWSLPVQLSPLIKGLSVVETSLQEKNDRSIHT